LTLNFVIAKTIKHLFLSSWFPLAALKACFNAATFLRNGQVWL